MRLKLSNMRDRLLGMADPTIMLILSAEDTSTQDGAEVIADFMQSTAPLPGWMDAVARLD